MKALPQADADKGKDRKAAGRQVSRQTLTEGDRQASRQVATQTGIDKESTWMADDPTSSMTPSV